MRPESIDLMRIVTAASPRFPEIGKMFDEGRIARPDPMVHKMGQSPQPAAAVAPKTVEKKPSNAGNWVFRVLAGLAALWLINTDAGSDFLA